ncbi:ALQxL family class IV lanthipeptide [Streptacidiphilus sp. PB12-B1b]|nr:ALQxL family class IV lanthipeptide [Streptacidiphilus sp. PB12-B1b]
MTIDVDALQALESDESEAEGLIPVCPWTCSWTSF